MGATASEWVLASVPIADMDDWDRVNQLADWVAERHPATASIGAGTAFDQGRGAIRDLEFAGGSFDEMAAFIADLRQEFTTRGYRIEIRVIADGD